MLNKSINDDKTFLKILIIILYRIFSLILAKAS